MSGSSNRLNNSSTSRNRLKNTRSRAFLERLSLAPDDMAKLSYGNADALLKLKAGAVSG